MILSVHHKYSRWSDRNKIANRLQINLITSFVNFANHNETDFRGFSSIGNV